MGNRFFFEKIFERNLDRAPSEDIRQNLLDNKEDIIGEVEFFDLMKRANRDLNGHERWIIWTVTKRLLRNDDE